MVQIYPFKGISPKPELAAKVIAPPYDVVSRAQVKAWGQGNPYNFLHVTRPEADLADNIKFDDPQVYQQAKTAWQELLKEQVLEASKEPALYVYAMQTEKSTQMGVLSLVDIRDYEKGDIRRHELTRPDKENDRIKHIQTVDGQLSPVLLTVRDEGEILKQLQNLANSEADLEGKVGNVQHKIWCVTDKTQQQALTSLFQNKMLYIADGHHRTAAALRSHKESPKGSGPAENPYCLAAIFPSQQMDIWGYHRVVQDLNGLSAEQLLEKLAESYAIELLEEPALPSKPGDVHMLLAKNTYRLSRYDLEQETDPVARLDVDHLAKHVLTPLLGITDVRTDPRISFVGGPDALDNMHKQVVSGEQAVAFAMYPTQMQQLLDVSDANELMPPKSTWFEPKLADGLVCYSF
jgi:uncharacterized protein (DUF1015 family)